MRVLKESERVVVVGSVSISVYVDSEDVSVDQADELAKYFLGPQFGAWAGMVVAKRRLHYVGPPDNPTRFYGVNFLDALRKAGADIPQRAPEGN